MASAYFTVLGIVAGRLSSTFDCREEHEYLENRAQRPLRDTRYGGERIDTALGAHCISAALADITDLMVLLY